MQDYLTLTIVISSGPDDKLRVRANSKEGQGNANIAYIEIQDFAGLASGITRSSRAIASTSAAASSSANADPQKMVDELGTALFDALFQGSVRDVLRDTVSAAQEQSDRDRIETGVRIRLIIDMEDQKTAEVASLPWELMRADKHAGSPLVLSSETTLVRSIDVPKSTVIRPLDGALRILLIKSNPIGTAPLKLEEESSELKQKIDVLTDVEVDEVPPRRNAILKKLKDRKYHIVHYMGHGDFSGQTGGMLLMEDEDGDNVSVSSEEFKIWMQHPSLRLVFLNACNTGTTGDELGLHPFAGVATALISGGLPAVIAMQFPISDGAAIDFSETFYERLAQGLPVEAAVTEGRKKMLAETEWATPVLYLRAQDGNLFERVENDAPAEKDAKGAGVSPPAAAVPSHPDQLAAAPQAPPSGPESSKTSATSYATRRILVVSFIFALCLLTIMLNVLSDDGTTLEVGDTAETDPGTSEVDVETSPAIPDRVLNVPNSPTISRDAVDPATVAVDDSDDDPVEEDDDDDDVEDDASEDENDD